VGIGAGGPHIIDESWELDRGSNLVLWCGILERGVDTRGVNLGGVSLPEVLLTVYFGTPNMFITLWFGFDYGTNPPLGTLII
jgi:hypothetical protein